LTINHPASTSIDGVIVDAPSLGDIARRAILDRRTSHLEAIQRLGECEDNLMRAAELLTKTLQSGRTVLTLGNGGSAAEAQHFAGELVGRFHLERRPFPVLALTADSSILTAIANDYDFSEVFSRQVEAFVREGDLLIAFSTSGESENVIQAAHAAQNRGAAVIAMTGDRPSRLGQSADITVQAPSTDTPTIQELHCVFTHVLCDVGESFLARHDDGSFA
jgi:D-sedoheptulose 7-phosphate isomerase